MFEYVLIVYLLSDYKDPTYVGHFVNCDRAFEYKDENYPDHQSAKCLLSDYVGLPKNLIIKEIK